MAPLSHEQLLSAILDRSSIDREFRRRLLLEPRRAIEDAFGVVIPVNFSVRFVEKEPGLDALVVLPDLVNSDGQLSDDDLDAVSGGVEDAQWDA